MDLSEGQVAPQAEVLRGDEMRTPDEEAETDEEPKQGRCRARRPCCHQVVAACHLVMRTHGHIGADEEAA
jgi:hypothetical protein